MGVIPSAPAGYVTTLVAPIETRLEPLNARPVRETVGGEAAWARSPNALDAASAGLHAALTYSAGSKFRGSMG
jgi:hypothetical protein